MDQTPADISLDDIDNFPAFARAGAFLKAVILERGCKTVADVGGGANPMLDDAFIKQHGIRYFVIDRSGAELRKAHGACETIEADVTAPLDAFMERIGNQRFDLIFSHMLLEHIEDPHRAHSNLFAALNPGGRCVHFYPSPNNLPLAVNRFLPERVTTLLVKFAQPKRDLDGPQGKFKAYYRWCGAPGPGLTAAFEQIGFFVRRHTGYVGHTYYERFKPLAAIERQLRKLILKLGLPLTSDCLLVLEKAA